MEVEEIISHCGDSCHNQLSELWASGYYANVHSLHNITEL